MNRLSMIAGHVGSQAQPGTPPFPPAPAPRLAPLAALQHAPQRSRG